MEFQISLSATADKKPFWYNEGQEGVLRQIECAIPIYKKLYEINAYAIFIGRTEPFLQSV